MKSSLSFLLTLLISITAFSQSLAPSYNLSAKLAIYLNHLECIDEQTLVHTKIGDQVYLNLMILVDEFVVEEELTALGVIVNSKIEEVWTILVPKSSLRALTHVQGIEYLELDHPIIPAVHKARKHTRVDSVHAGIGLDMPLSGEGVIVGIIDAGYEYHHPTFYDVNGTHLRIDRIWEQKKNGTPPTGYVYGNELKDTVSMRAAVQDAPGSHGVHVGGIAAGSGFGGDSTEFRGVAYKSNLVLVGIRPEEEEWTSTGLSSVADGAKYIYDYADQQGKAAVVNLSWGGAVGPGDGSSLFARAINSLTGEGKLFAVSAGNSADGGQHVTKDFSTSDSVLHTFLQFGYTDSNFVKHQWIDIWGEEGESFCIEYTLFYGSDSSRTSQIYCLDGQTESTFLVGKFGDTCRVVMSRQAATFNGRPRMLLNIANASSNLFSLKIRSTSGRVHAWAGYVKGYWGHRGAFFKAGLFGNTEGDSKYDMGITANVNNAFTVAAYSSKPVDVNYFGSTLNLSSSGVEGNITSFSSNGPTTDHKLKPNISAPGMMLTSGVNKNDIYYISGSGRPSLKDKLGFQGEEYWYANASGTSMAAPMVTGILALMLEVDPNLTPAKAMYIVRNTAILDSFTTANPDSTRWGWGKINAYQAVLAAAAKVGVEELQAAENFFAIYPNPSGGSITLLPKNPSLDAQLEIIDLSGRTVLQKQLQSNSAGWKIDVSSLNAGVYWVRLEQDGVILTERLVVE
ncbi:MAG: S8 family peptidase [Bacteroidia bacterium]